MTKRLMALLSLAALALASMPPGLDAQAAQAAPPAGPAAARTQPAGPVRISMEEFKKRYAADEVVVVDVRSVESYAEGHIAGALSVPLDDLQSYVPRLKALEKPIVTYCA